MIEEKKDEDLEKILDNLLDDTVDDFERIVNETLEEREFIIKSCSENKDYIIVSEDFAENPINGKIFYETILKPKFEKCLTDKSKLVIDLDGTYGYTNKFISNSFGKLSGEYGYRKVLDVLMFKSEDEIELAKRIVKLMKEGDVHE